MLIETLQILFKRNLERLSQEIGQYQNEVNIWIIDGNISNSAGNLCLHLVGNLNTYIGGAFVVSSGADQLPSEVVG